MQEILFLFIYFKMNAHTTGSTAVLLTW